MEEPPDLSKVLEADIWLFDLDWTLLNSLDRNFDICTKFSLQTFGFPLHEKLVRDLCMEGTLDRVVLNISDYNVSTYGVKPIKSLEKGVDDWIKISEYCPVLPSVYDGAVDLLALGKRIGKKIGIITSATKFDYKLGLNALYEFQKDIRDVRKLVDTGVAFEDVIHTDGIAYGKPHPWAYDIATDSLDNRQNLKRVYVGDGITDIQFGRNIGAYTIFLGKREVIPKDVRHLEEYTPHAIFRNILELYLAVIQELNKRRLNNRIYISISY